MFNLNLDLNPSSIPGSHDIVRQELGNGIVVLVRENHSSPTVVLNGLLQAGAIYNLPDRAGLARFTASALMRGASKRSFTQIFEEVESVGASLGFSAGRHITGFSGQCLVEDLDLLLDIVQDALFAPTFPAEQLEKLRGQILTGLQIQDHNTRVVAGRQFNDLAYPAGHPYSYRLTGTAETVSAIQREDIVAFHKDYYGPRGMLISVVGDVNATAIIAKLEAWLGAWPAAAVEVDLAPLPMVEPLATVQQAFVPVPGKTQSDIVLGVAGPPRSAEDFLPARLANTVLGVFGLMGRLGANLRDRQGLAYYCSSQLQGGLGPGAWLISAGVNPTNVEQAIASMRDELRRLQDELVPADELADNKSFMIGSLPIHLETNDGVADTILDMELYQLGLDYLQNYPETMGQITAEQVQAVAQKYLNPDAYALAVAGPEG